MGWRHGGGGDMGLIVGWFYADVSATGLFLLQNVHDVESKIQM